MALEPQRALFTCGRFLLAVSALFLAAGCCPSSARSAGGIRDLVPQSFERLSRTGHRQLRQGVEADRDRRDGGRHRSVRAPTS
jgi:hypothetical protein